MPPRPTTGLVVPADAMDAAWFTSILASDEAVGEVTSVEASPIGTGQVGENIRFRLRWSDGTTSSIVGKFPSDNEQSFATAQQMGIYASEVGFYRDIAPTINIRVPVVSYIGFDPETTRFCLLMEDITPAEQGDQLTGTDIATAELVVAEAVKLHAPTWGRAEELAELPWLAAPSIESALFRNEIVRSVFDGFADRYSHVLSADDIELGRRLMGRLDDLSRAQTPTAFGGVSGAWCLAHQDYRLDNMLFSTGPGSPPLVIVDWQTCRLGSGPADIAYFCGAGLSVSDRRAAEGGLVDRYVAGLIEAGVPVDVDVIRMRYVLGSASGYIMAVLASQVVGQTERGDAMFCVMAERHAAQMRDLDFFGELDRFDSGRGVEA